MLRGWLDACIVCPKPNGKGAYFWHVRFIILRDTLLQKILVVCNYKYVIKA